MWDCNNIFFNNDSILLASHFDETFDLINRIKDKIQSISNEKIYNIKIFYSQSQGTINNKFINNQINKEEIISLLSATFKINQNITLSTKYHDSPITCSKFFEQKIFGNNNINNGFIKIMDLTSNMLKCNINDIAMMKSMN